MSGILAILVPILNSGAVFTPGGVWDPFIFNDDESEVPFTLSGTSFAFNLTQAEQNF